MLVPHASLTRSPLRPNSTARAAWSWSIALRGEQERGQLGAVQARALDGWTLGRRTYWAGFADDVAIDVREPVEATHRREPPVDRRGRQAFAPRASTGTARCAAASPRAPRSRRRWPTGRTPAGHGDTHPTSGRCSGPGKPATARCASSNGAGLLERLHQSRSSNRVLVIASPPLFGRNQPNTRPPPGVLGDPALAPS